MRWLLAGFRARLHYGAIALLAVSPSPRSPLVVGYLRVSSWIRHAAATGAILALSGCAATLPAVPAEIRIPVPVACIDKLPDKPALFTDEQLSKMGDAELIISLRIDQLNARGYIAQADALMMACVK